MFEKFRALFSPENLLEAAFKNTLTMIEFDQRMFEASRRTLRETDTDELPFDVRDLDHKINQYEMEVRRQVLTHLTVAGTQNLVPGLVLVSIVIDVERIGDYTKNIADLAGMHKNRLAGGKFEETLKKIETFISESFPKVSEILDTQDSDQAREMMAREPEIASMAESVLTSLATEDDDVNVGDAVCLALYARYLKRINAHATNIVSSIVNPFPSIGFREQD